MTPLYPQIVATLEDEAAAQGMTVAEAFSDSLVHVGLVMAIESRFGVDIPDSAVDKLKQPYDFDKYLESRV